MIGHYILFMSGVLALISVGFQLQVNVLASITFALIGIGIIMENKK